MAKTALALLDLSGYREGVSKENMKKSAEVLKKALYQGNYIGMDTLVMAYLTGDMVEYFTDNKAKDFEGLKAFANKGYVEGIENLGLLCAQEGDSVEAEKYLKSWMN